MGVENRTKKSNLIHRVMKKHRLPRRKAELITNTFFEGIKSALARGSNLEIRGFGSFILRDYQAYRGRNPKTGEAVYVAPKKQPFFKASKAMRTRVNNQPPC